MTSIARKIWSCFLIPEQSPGGLKTKWNHISFWTTFPSHACTQSATWNKDDFQEDKQNPSVLRLKSDLALMGCGWSVLLLVPPQREGTRCCDAAGRMQDQHQVCQKLLPELNSCYAQRAQHPMFGCWALPLGLMKCLLRAKLVSRNISYRATAAIWQNLPKSLERTKESMKAAQTEAGLAMGTPRRTGGMGWRIWKSYVIHVGFLVLFPLNSSVLFVISSFWEAVPCSQQDTLWTCWQWSPKRTKSPSLGCPHAVEGGGRSVAPIAQLSFHPCYWMGEDCWGATETPQLFRGPNYRWNLGSGELLPHRTCAPSNMAFGEQISGGGGWSCTPGTGGGAQAAAWGSCREGFPPRLLWFLPRVGGTISPPTHSDAMLQVILRRNNTRSCSNMILKCLYIKKYIFYWGLLRISVIEDLDFNITIWKCTCNFSSDHINAKPLYMVVMLN